MRRTSLVLVGQFLLIFLLGCAVRANWLGIGISCEPVDISGGGFFADVSWNAQVFELGGLGYACVRPIFGVGPLPLQVKWFILDGFLTAEFPQKYATLYAGIGFGIVVSLQGELVSRSLIGILGLSNVKLADNLQMYAQVRVRGEGFFTSPGVGLQWTF